MGPILIAMRPRRELLQAAQSSGLSSSRNHLMVLCMHPSVNVLPDEGLNGQITEWASMRAIA